MLMVVFGAGASYDSVPARPLDTLPLPHHPDRPPLAKELFDNRREFLAAMSRFQKSQPIIPYLQNAPDGSVERVLENLQAEADKYPERHRQLAAIRFYLHFMLWECEQRWNEIARGITNQKTLLDQIQRWYKGRCPVCLVTFNYDRMVEGALPSIGIEIKDLPDYVAAEDWKLIKLHGSVNWGREVNTPIQNVVSRNVWDIGRELIDRAPELDISQRYRMVAEYPIGKFGETALFPAIAIPVETKRDFECPPEHLEALRACIPKVTKLLLIGWRATEMPFVQLLADNLSSDVRVMAVAGSAESAGEILTRVEQAGIEGKFIVGSGGFTEFVVRRDGDEFLKS